MQQFRESQFCLSGVNLGAILISRTESLKERQAFMFRGSLFRGNCVCHQRSSLFFANKDKIVNSILQSVFALKKQLGALNRVTFRLNWLEFSNIRALRGHFQSFVGRAKVAFFKNGPFPASFWIYNFLFFLLHCLVSN